MASWIAAVSSVIPLPVAPKSLTLRHSPSLAATVVATAPAPGGVYVVCVAGTVKLFGKIPLYTALFTSLSHVATTGVVPSTKIVELTVNPY
jgi:hypothetical protein